MIILRPGISYCRVEDRLIFLDRVADRYFCLSPSAERAIAELGDRGTAMGIDAPLQRLLDAGLLVETVDGSPVSPCASPRVPTHSLLDDTLPSASVGATIAALGDLAKSRIRLKALGLKRVLRRLDYAKQLRCGDRCDASSVAYLQPVAAFAGAEGIVSALDNCLSRSIAMANRLFARGMPATLVIGVRLGPFNAHCWVQHHDRLLNDRFDMVRMFTPILVI